MRKLILLLVIASFGCSKDDDSHQDECKCDGTFGVYGTDQIIEAVGIPIDCDTKQAIGNWGNSYWIGCDN